MAGRWSLVPVVLLRHAGFPFDMLRPLRSSVAVEGVAALQHRHTAVTALATRLKRHLRGARSGTAGNVGAVVGRLRPLSTVQIAELSTLLTGREMPALHEYQQGVLDLDRAWHSFAAEYDEQLAQGRAAVVATYTDPALREVLLLSNDAYHSRFVSWLDAFEGQSDRTARRMSDMLTMYLQRVTTKNETNSHFGPVSVGRVVSDPPGLSWEVGALRREAFFSHWAAEAVVAIFNQKDELRDQARPRRHPLSFLTERRIVWFTFDAGIGMHADWRLAPGGTADLDDDGVWLYEHCDGERRVSELRDLWSARGGTLPHFSELLATFSERGWLVAEWEVPVGAVHPLRDVAAALEEAPADVSAELAVLAEFENFLSGFSTGSSDERPELLHAAKSEFERVTGSPASRPGGTHYADRSILFEEAHSPLRELTLGDNVAAFVEDELALVYDLVLVAPKLRLRREQDVMRTWVERTFGPDVPVPLHDFYTGFFANKSTLDSECDAITAEIEQLDRDIMATVLEDEDPAAHEIAVPKHRLDRVLRRYPAGQTALVGPDIMLVAPDAEAVATGDFSVVVGDCHAVQDLLTNTSLAPLIERDAPEIVDEVSSGYDSILDEDEILVESARPHTDKTGARLPLPCPDLEVLGRSAKARKQVLQPSQLYVIARDGRLELRATDLPGRLRLKTPPAGGLSVTQDPLSVFSLPRHFAGVSMLRNEAMKHVPRIRCGRVVLRRESWRIPVTALRGWRPGEGTVSSGAAEFFAGCALRERLDLPRYVFVKVPGEPKPIFVDWESPLLVRQLFRLARGSRGSVELTEMLPGPDEMWLDIDGHRYTSEFRCSLFARSDL